MTTATRTTRQLAVGALLAGSLAAFVSSFLPFGRATYQSDIYTPGPPIRVEIFVTAQDLIEVLQVSIQNPGNLLNLAITLIWAFLVWGIPLVLLALGAAALWRRPRHHRATVYFVGLLLVLIGAGYTLLTCISYESYLYPWFGSLPALTRTLEYGSLVTLLGYLSAFVAIVWSWWSSRRTRSERNSPASHP